MPLPYTRAHTFEPNKNKPFSVHSHDSDLLGRFTQVSIWVDQTSSARKTSQNI